MKFGIGGLRDHLRLQERVAPAHSATVVENPAPADFPRPGEEGGSRAVLRPREAGREGDFLEQVLGVLGLADGGEQEGEELRAVPHEEARDEGLPFPIARGVHLLLLILGLRDAGLGGKTRNRERPMPGPERLMSCQGRCLPRGLGSARSCFEHHSKRSFTRAPQGVFTRILNPGQENGSCRHPCSRSSSSWLRSEVRTSRPQQP